MHKFICTIEQTHLEIMEAGENMGETWRLKVGIMRKKWSLFRAQQNCMVKRVKCLWGKWVKGFLKSVRALSNPCKVLPSRAECTWNTQRAGAHTLSPSLHLFVPPHPFQVQPFKVSTTAHLY